MEKVAPTGYSPAITPSVPVGLKKGQTAPRARAREGQAPSEAPTLSLRGPDATREMLRISREHSLPQQSGWRQFLREEPTAVQASLHVKRVRG